MKHLNFVKSIVVAFITFTCILTSCTKTNTTTQPDELQTKTEGENVLATTITPQYCKSDTVCLWAGQTIDAGNVIISNDANNLYITVNSDEGFQNSPENIKIWVGGDLDNLPTNGQNVPVPGQFPFKYDATGNSFTATIQLSEIVPLGTDPVTCNNVPIYVFVHVDIIANGGGETAWGGCIPGSKDVNRWYFYHKYTTQCCDTPPPPTDCFAQTAFGKGGYVFTTDKKSNPENLPSLMLTKNRWGWVINLTVTGATTYDIWAGAGLNYTSKGKLVGKLTVNWDGTTATVTYSMASGFTLVETHVYAGDFKPTTIAPGQYGNTVGFNPPATWSTGSYYVTDTNNDGIWIIAHAGVYGCY